MQLEKITKPFLKSEMSIKNFAHKVELSPSRVSQIILRDLNHIHNKLYKDNNFELRNVPKIKDDRKWWLLRIEEYIELMNLPNTIRKDNRKISDLTVYEFIVLMSSLKK